MSEYIMYGYDMFVTIDAFWIQHRLGSRVMMT